MKPLFYDFHIHSCLSPCGDEDMTPCNIVGMACLKQLDIIALTDHNSCKNCEALMKAAADAPIRIVAGMELCTSEEIHVICLFNTLDKALIFDEYIYSKIPDIKNNADIFGRQVIMDFKDREIGEEGKLLINAANISIMEVAGLMKQFDGIAYPAHIDKSSYSILSNLGFIPPECGFSYYEVANLSKKEELTKAHLILKQMQFIKSSDAHYLENISERENRLTAKEILKYFLL